ncbi:MAG: hypothetical protein AAB901_01620 [Patescibacteria group bacterium]
MKWYLLIGAILLILLAVGGYFVFFAPSRTTTNPPDNAGTFPGGGNATTTPGTTGQMQVVLQNGQQVTAQDVVHNGTTVEDPANPSTYYIAGSSGYCNPDGSCPSGVPSEDFNIVYNATEQTFIIALLKEPLGEARQAAEELLLQKLGIAKTQMCALKYYVGTDAYTNEQYAGMNLGFSFCAGATKLP